MIANRYRVYLWSDGNVLELDRGAADNITNVLNATELSALN